MTTKNKNDQFSITKMWKKHRQRIALTTTVSLLAMGGTGVGIGYAIWHNNNSNNIPAETSIKIYGPNSTNGRQGVASSINYNAINNIGENITTNAK
jgi:hypothetical protein